MDVLEKAKRIEALTIYNEYKSPYAKLNYSLNAMIGDKTYLVRFEDIYNNIYQAWEDIYKTEEEVGLGVLNNDAIAIEAELWEKIVSDIYIQFYHISYQKAAKIALEKITIAEVELNIKHILEQ